MAVVPIQKADIIQLEAPSQDHLQQQDSGSGLEGSVPSPLDMAPPGAYYYLTEGLEGVEAQRYRCTESFMTAINLQTDQLHSGNASQYAVFSHITPHQLADLNRFRDTHCKSLRFLYYEYEETLVVKITPGAAHEVALTRFEIILTLKIASIGLLDEISYTRAATYKGTECGKEPDSSFRSRQFRPYATNWPTLVIECGVPESINRLRVDSNWWFANSEAQVKTVLLISISEKDRKILIEQWEMLPEVNPQVTCHELNPARIRPECIRTIEIVEADAGGASLQLSFQNLFLREPVQGETDIVFTTRDLERFAAYVWLDPRPEPLSIRSSKSSISDPGSQLRLA